MSVFAILAKAAKRTFPDNEPDMPWKSARRATTFLAALLAMYATMIPSAGANYADKSSLTLTEVGQTGTFTVTSYGCPWLATITSADTSVATVTPATSNSEPQIFTVTAKGAGTTTITVSYDQYGKDSYGYDCVYSGDLVLTASVEIPQPGSTANNPGSGDDGDPVNTFNGELFFYEPPDLDVGGPFPLIFKRYYASYLRKSFIVGDLGDNWRHNYEWSLHWAGNTISVVSANGKLLKFLQDGSDNWNLQTTNAGSYQLVMATESGTNVFYLADSKNDIVYKFSAGGKLVGMQSASGASLNLVYDTSGGVDDGRLVEVNDGGLKALKFTYDYAGAGRKLYTASAYFNNALSESVGFGYFDGSNPSWLTDFTDVNGGATGYFYQSPDGADTALLTKKRYPNGSLYYHHLQTYYTIADSQFDSGKVKTQTDRDGNVQTFTYAGNATTLTDAEGANASHTHSTGGSLTGATDKDGIDIAIAYDANGNRVAITSPLNHSVQRTYHAPSGKLASITNELGEVTTFAYTPRSLPSGIVLYDLANITYPDNTAESFTYSSSGHLASRTDQGGQLWSYTSNSLGQILTETNPLGGVTTYTYGADNNLASIRDDASNTTTFTYEYGKRLLQITRPDGATRTYTKSTLSGLTSIAIENENADTTTSYYDKNGNNYQVINPLSGTTGFVFDYMDRLKRIDPPVGNSMLLTYDTLGRIATMTPPNANTITYTYDSRGHVTRETDSIGTKASVYDAVGRLLSKTDETGRTISYTYDAAGHLTTIKTPSANETTFSYDAMGRVVSVTDPLGNSVATSYDSMGLPVGVALPGGVSAFYVRNGIGEITAITDPNGKTQTRDFDKQGRLTSVTDTLGKKTSYAYNNMNKVATITYPGTLGTLSYTYDAKGNITKMTYSDATALNYAFDANGRLLSGDGFSLVRDALGKIIDSNGIANTYDASRRLAQITLATGATEKAIAFGHDARDRVNSIDDWTAHGPVSLTYDAVGRPLTIVRPNGITSAYTYDGDGNLASITEGAIASLTITRDAKGRIRAISRSDPAGMPAPAPPPVKPAATFNSGYQNTAHTFDDLGRRTNDGARTYTWDLASRLSSYAQGAVSAFTYDANGLVLSKAGATQFVWNYATSIPTPMIFRDGTGVDQSYNVFTPEGVLVYRILADGTRRYFHFDETGNTWFVSDDAGNITDFYRYSPYGEIVASSGAGAEVFTYQGRTGVMQEGSTGLYYMRARYYDSASGSFISKDPIPGAHPLTINPYRYAANNPMVYADPRGTASHANDQLKVAEVGSTALGQAADKLGDAAASGVKTYQEIAELTSNPELKKEMLRRAARLKGLGAGLAAAGHVNTLNGHVNTLNDAYGEATKMGEAQREAIAASQIEAQNILDSWKRDWDVLDGKLKRKEITREKYWEAKLVINRDWEAQLEANAKRGFNEVLLETVKGGLRALWQTTGLPTSTLNKYLNWLSEE